MKPPPQESRDKRKKKKNIAKEAKRKGIRIVQPPKLIMPRESLICLVTPTPTT